MDISFRWSILRVLLLATVYEQQNRTLIIRTGELDWTIRLFLVMLNDTNENANDLISLVVSFGDFLAAPNESDRADNSVQTPLTSNGL